MNSKRTLSLVICAAVSLGGQMVAAQDPAAWIAGETAKDYRERARYPESSRALRSGEEDPVKAKRTPTRQSLRAPDGSALSVWASAVSVEALDPIDLFASFDGRGKAAAAAAVDAVTAEIANAEGGVVAEVVYKDDGQGADRRAGDGVYSARLALPAGLEPALAESYVVRVRARLADGDLREAAGGFLYSNPAARLTGRYRDLVRDGNLVVAAEVDVREAGRFHLAASLYSLAGEPVGAAQAAAVLEPGRHWLELPFYGLMFHDRPVAGPYRLKSVGLSTTTRMPNALNDLVEDAHVVRPFRLERMTREPFREPGLSKAAERIEKAVRP